MGWKKALLTVAVSSGLPSHATAATARVRVIDAKGRVIGTLVEPTAR